MSILKLHPEGVAIHSALRMHIGKFWIRPQIDGNICTVGGQQFYVEYKNKVGEWTTTDTKPVRGYEGGGDSESYHYCGPFELTDRDTTQPVRIHLLQIKDAMFMDPDDTFRAIGNTDYYDLAKMFDYYEEDDEGDYQPFIFKYGTYADTTGLRNSCPSIDQAGADGIYRCVWGPIMMMIDRTATNYIYGDDVGGWNSITWVPNWGIPWVIRDLDLENDAQGTWTSHSGDLIQQWFKEATSQRYNQLTSIYKEFSAEEFSVEVANTEGQIYNYDINEMVSTPRVIDYNFQFDLKILKNMRPEELPLPVDPISDDHPFDLEPDSIICYSMRPHIFAQHNFAHPRFAEWVTGNSSGDWDDLFETGSHFNGWSHFDEISGSMYQEIFWLSPEVSITRPIWAGFGYFCIEYGTTSEPGSWVCVPGESGRSLGALWTFGAFNQHDTEGFFTSGNILHVVSNAGSPTPTVINKSANLSRHFGHPISDQHAVWHADWYDEEYEIYPPPDWGECYAHDYGDSTNPFSAITEDTPIYYF